MKNRLDPEVVKKGLIDSFEVILELDKNPKKLKELPSRSILIRRGNRRMLIPVKKKSHVIVI